MSRAAGISRNLVLPTPPDQYNATDQREVRRLIELNSKLLNDYSTLTSVPAPVGALGALTGTADTVPYFTGISTMALAALTPFARTILACASAATMRTALGLGPLAILTTPSDATKFLNGAASPAFAQVKDSDLSVSNITTNNVSNTKHGFAPISPADATKFMNGAATPAFAQVKDSDLAVSNITTNDVSTTAHGFAPKAPNDATKFLDGTGAYSVPSSGGTGSPAVLTDTTDLVARYAMDSPLNTVAANTGIVTVFKDLTGNGHDWTPGSGVITKQYGGLSGLPVAFFATGLTATSAITIPLKGALTYYAILKVTSTVNYQNLFGPTLSPAQPSDLHLYWDQPSNKWQVDGRLTSNATVAGRWIGLVVHYFNTSGAMHVVARENGAQVLADIVSTNGSNPIQGTSGTPVNYGLGLFRHPSAGLPFTSQILEWGFYAATRNGSEATLEAYMRARAGVW